MQCRYIFSGFFSLSSIESTEPYACCWMYLLRCFLAVFIFTLVSIWNALVDLNWETPTKSFIYFYVGTFLLDMDNKIWLSFVSNWMVSASPSLDSHSYIQCKLFNCRLHAIFVPPDWFNTRESCFVCGWFLDGGVKLAGNLMLRFRRCHFSLALCEFCRFYRYIVCIWYPSFCLMRFIQAIQ